MDRERIGQLVFFAALLLALTLYALTAPDGLPWNDSTHLALAYLGEIVRLPTMPHPVWGRYVQVFGGAVALSSFLVALGAGLLGAVVNRRFGWRLAVAVSTVWIFLPGVWNRAITGERGICLVAIGIVVLWLLNAIADVLCAKLAALFRSSLPVTAGEGALATPSSHGVVEKLAKVNRLVGWVALGSAGLFAVVSLTLHDYKLGEAASAYARGVVWEAGERIVVMNGVCDDQVVREMKTEERSVHCPPPLCFSTLSLRTDDAYRTNLVVWVKSAFPGETNLWVAAQVSPQTFAMAATKAHPERFYLMGGKSTTVEQWERRWESFRPHLESSDPFVRVARRLFGQEGNAVANAMRHVHSSPSSLKALKAWRLYRRIYVEIDPGNFSALVNMSEMIRRGHAVSGDERKKVNEALEGFFMNPQNRQHMKEIARLCGPVRSDPDVLAKLEAEAKERLAAKVAAGGKIDVSPEILSLVEWNNAMVEAMDRGEGVRAGRIARAILSNPKWKGHVPANAVLGAVTAEEGDFVASESFFRAATSTTNRVPAVAWNDYADTLLHLGKLDEAEKAARRAVKESDGKFWLAQLTLAQVMERKCEKCEWREKCLAEYRALLKELARRAPKAHRERILDMQRKAWRQ